MFLIISSPSPSSEEEDDEDDDSKEEEDEEEEEEDDDKEEDEDDEEEEESEESLNRTNSNSLSSSILWVSAPTEHSKVNKAKHTSAFILLSIFSFFFPHKYTLQLRSEKLLIYVTM